MKRPDSHDTRSQPQAKRLKGDVVLRQKIQQWIPFITVLILAAAAYVIHRLRSFADIPGDPCVAASELSRVIGISGTVATALLGFVGVVVIWVAFSSWKERVFPPSVLPVVRDTLQRVGNDAMVRSAILAALGVLIVAVSAYGYSRVNGLLVALSGAC